MRLEKHYLVGDDRKIAKLDLISDCYVKVRDSANSKTPDLRVYKLVVKVGKIGELLDEEDLKIKECDYLEFETKEDEVMIKIVPSIKGLTTSYVYKILSDIRDKIREAQLKYIERILG